MEQAPRGVDLALSAIELSLSPLRLVDPRAQERMLASVRRQGQLTPVVVGGFADQIVLIDGFKRYRSLQQLGAPTIRVQVIEVTVRAMKAAMVQLNGYRGGMTSLEEALVLRSLHQDDALTQEEIGVLLGRHKSWVCRRLALVQRLCDEALEQLRLGLISAGICRHLLLLPRGNQPRALACVIKHRLSSRETARLVQLLREYPERDHETLLWLPLPILEDRVAARPRALTGAAATLAQRLLSLERKARVAAESVPAAAAAAWGVQTRDRINTQIQSLNAAITKLRELVSRPTNNQEEVF
jgi:ParB/RepB/Spo0J family partition protein